ncbi:MAG: FHA domain-containing protein [Clostridiales bacterium]|nr:FHA domain-containing protein [Clostridiales bacterium]
MQRTCSAGHVYDADQFASCPYCNRNTRAIQFGATAAPAGYGATTAPAGYGAAPAGRDDTIGQTVMPEAIRRRMEQERDNRTVGEFKRKLGYEPVVGWLVCVEGPEVGKDYRLFGRINSIGRAEGNDVVLAQEHTVSQKNHVRLAYDAKHNNFQLIPGEGTNVTYLNDEPLYVPQKLNAYDVLEMGDTKLIFVPLCSERFRWPEKRTEGAE